LVNNLARVVLRSIYGYSKHEGSGPPPDMGVEPQAALSSILANSTLLHLVTLTLELLRDQLPEVLLPIFFFKTLQENAHINGWWGKPGPYRENPPI